MRELRSMLSWTLRFVVGFAIAYIFILFGESMHELFNSKMLLSKIFAVIIILITVVILFGVGMVSMPIAGETAFDLHRVGVVVFSIVCFLFAVFITPIAEYGLSPFSWKTWWLIIPILGVMSYIISFWDAVSCMRLEKYVEDIFETEHK